MPSKIQFDQLATSWVTKDSQLEKVVNAQVIKQTYRLNFEHCVANSCKRNCIGNPRCLSALGGALLANHANNKLNDAPDFKNRETRELTEPAGLKNLGATCYLNSLLQVWFHNTKFRDVILKWNRELDCGELNSLGFELPETIVGHIQLIFARLLRSIRRWVDPTALVEVLGLDAEYQQDASECCSLLFNVILDQLRMYEDGSLAKELADAYRGKQVTVIQCENCGAIKRCQQDFYNMILNVQGHRDVRQCIKSLRQSRKIEGDFNCGTCMSKKGAVTFEEFMEMPSVLNLQLMRYRYDAKNGTKKKVQTAMRFPEVLDLSPYLKELNGEKLYALRAVLVHVGHSANSGHYIANVRAGDDGVWFRLNDENVSAIKGRLDLNAETELNDDKDIVPRSNGFKNRKSSSNGNSVPVAVQNENIKQTKPTPQSIPSNNKGTINVSNDSEPSLNAMNVVNPTQAANRKRGSPKQLKNAIEKKENDEHTFTSTGAYMLVYERIPTNLAESTKNKHFITSKLHNYLEDIIQKEHGENTRQAKEIESIRSFSISKAHELLSDFKAIFNVLAYKTDGSYRFLTTTSLTSVIKKTELLFRNLCNAIEQPLATKPGFKNEVTAKTGTDTATNSFTCVHGRLNPDGADLSKLKVISSTTASLLDNFCEKYDLREAWLQGPVVPQELCRECVVLLGRRLAKLSQLGADSKAFIGYLKNKDNKKSFWVHEKSLQNWFKLAESKILAELGSKPAEAIEVFNDRLRCVHGNLVLEHKKSVPEKAWEILRKYFPSCVVYEISTPECDQCRSASLAEKAIASERAEAMFVLRQSLKGLMKFKRSFQQSETEAYAIHTDQALILRKYLRAVTKPNKLPSNFPNALLCIHGRSIVVVKDGVFSESVVLLTRDECDVLKEKFSIKSFIEIRRSDTSFKITPEPCENCLRRQMLEDRKAQLNFHNIEISIIKMPLEELFQKHLSLNRSKETILNADENSREDKSLEPAPKKQRLGRISRIPNAKTIVISSNETFVDLKVKIMAKHHITPILQVILKDDKLLSDIDGDVGIIELGIRPGSILCVAEDVIREQESDQEKEKSVREEIGFGGTKLMG